MQSGDDVLFVDGALLEELLHELVVALGHQFDQALVRGLGLFFHVGGNRADLRLAVAAHLVGVGVHLDQVDDAGKALLRAHGQLNGNHGAAEGGGQRIHHAGKVGALAVHASADDGARQQKLVGIVPDALGHDFHAADRVHHDQRAVHRGQHHLGFVDEHVEAGSIDQVDLGFAPLHDGRGGRDRHAARDFFLVVVGDGVAFIDAAEALRGPGGKKHGGCE